MLSSEGVLIDVNFVFHQLLILSGEKDLQKMLLMKWNILIRK